MTETKIYLNTWGAYNNGCIGYGWMTADEAEDFIEEDPERDGGDRVRIATAQDKKCRL